MVLIDLEKKVYEFIKEREHVRCIELSEEFGQGNHVICKEEDENLVIAFGMSEELSMAVINLTNRAEIIPVTTSIFSYVIDGNMLNIPIAKHPLQRGYKTEHWLPVTYCTFEAAVRENEKDRREQRSIKTALRRRIETTMR
jgi:hypothetical protein